MKVIDKLNKKKYILEIVNPILEHLHIGKAKVKLTPLPEGPMPGFTVECTKFFISAYIGCRVQNLIEPNRVKKLIEQLCFTIYIVKKDTGKHVMPYLFLADLPSLRPRTGPTLGLVIELTKLFMPSFMCNLEKSTNN